LNKTVSVETTPAESVGMRSSIRSEVLTRPVATLIVPAYNEEKGLPVVLKNIYDVLDARYEIIVVDDGSIDGTADVAAKFPCRVIRHEANLGKGEALKSGIRAASADRVMWIDADDTYPVETIPLMLEALSDGADMVCASRTEGRERIPAFNRVGNMVFRLSIQVLYGYGGKDPCTGLCAVKKEALLRMGLRGRRFTIDSEIAMKAGRMHLRILDFPIRYRERIGRTKLSGLKDGAQIMCGVIRYLFWRQSRTPLARDME
jgi:glycosyltransferase involved in cell wall biosynthesis